MAIGRDKLTHEPPLATCPQCGGSLGLLESGATTCATCLLATALSTLDEEDHAALGHARDAPALEQLNQLLPAFEFLELLGRGGGGWVYLATQRSLNRLVAIKLLRRRPLGFETDRHRFQHEAQTLADFNHPQLVTVHDFGSIESDQVGDQHDYLVMEYVAGPTLRQRLAQGPLSPSEAKRITLQIAEAMRYAHERGVVHRDLKPENVLFTSAEDGARVKVADFGIAKLVEGTRPQLGVTQRKYTATGMVVGTPYYMAPEWRNASGEVSPRGDIFSLGVMLYEMLTGTLPVGAFRSPQASHGAPTLLSDVAMRALAADPQDRFATADELMAAIETPSTKKRNASYGRRAALGVAVAAACVLLSLTIYDLMVPPAVDPRDNPGSVAMEQAPVEQAPVQQATVEQPSTDTPPPSEEPTAPPPPVADEKEVEIGEVQFSNRGSFDSQVSFELTVRSPELIERIKNNEATLHWVYSRSYQRPFGEDFEGQVPDLAGRDRVLIEATPRHHHGSMWPATIHVEERWGDADGSPIGKRRVSEPFRVQGWHTQGSGQY
jgi:serine/threonine protein kinase